MINALCDHVRRVKEANLGVQADGLRASVLARIVNLHEEGSEQTCFRSWRIQQTMSSGSASGSWRVPAEEKFL